jgi:hypothetical protein
MIQIEFKINKCSNDSIIEIRACLYCPLEYSSIEIMFRRNNDIIPIIDSSAGYILGHRVIVNQKIKVIAINIYNDSCDDISCVVEYLNQGQMIHYDYSIIKLNTRDNLNPEIRSDKIPIGYSSLKLPSKIKIRVFDDIVLNLLCPSDSFVASFGDMSNAITKTDIIFYVYKNAKTVTIPKEVVWINYNNYIGSELRCCELVRSVSHSVNILHKVEISDIISLSDIPSKKPVNLTDFRTPTKQMFDWDEWKLSDLSLLPVYKAKSQ